MAVFFLGTSNCIVGNSAVHTVRARLHEDVYNLSLGSSPSSTGLYLLQAVPRFAKGDVVFLDYTIIDGGSLINRVRTEDEVALAFEAVIHEVVRRGGIPVALINPIATGLREHGPAESIHLAVCNRAGVPVFDVAAICRDAHARGAPVTELMTDGAHQTSAVTAVIGRSLVDVVDVVRETPPTIVVSALRSIRTRIIAVPELVPPTHRIRRSSSLRSANLARLRVADSVVLSIQPNERLMGLMTNMGAPGAKIRITGADHSGVLSLSNTWENHKAKAFMSIFVEMAHQPSGTEDGVTIEVLPESAVATERTLALRIDHFDYYGEVQLEGALVAMADDLAAPLEASAARPYTMLSSEHATATDDIMRALGRPVRPTRGLAEKFVRKYFRRPPPLVRFRPGSREDAFGKLTGRDIACDESGAQSVLSSAIEQRGVHIERWTAGEQVVVRLAPAFGATRMMLDVDERSIAIRGIERTRSM